jgi:NDP-sugar pyrophosphorylase family protein
LNGEYYVSLAYRPMLEDGCRVAVYELQRFMQWGTPHDLEEYRHWSRIFLRLSAGDLAPASQPGTVMVPMAGLGTRFAKEGYDTPKPLILVSGQPMAVQAVTDLPEAEARVFVLLQDMPGREDIEATLRERFPGCGITFLESSTDGQARTCLLGLDEVEADAPLTIGACDNGTLYDGETFAGLLADTSVDVIVWVARRHPGAVHHPEMYGWVDADANGVVRRVSVKVALSDPATDPIVTGVFTFRRAGDFVAAAERLIAEDRRTNEEFYVDECINDAIAMGLRCHIFEVDGYVCWGTPDDLRTFNYWQSCFHHWGSHPYQADRDPRYHGSPPLLERAPWEIGGVGA